MEPKSEKDATCAVLNLKGPAPGYSKTVRIGLGRSTVGRGETNDIQLESGKVSRHHAALELTGSGKLVVWDVGSVNGVWIGPDAAITPTALKEGDVVGIGDYQLTLLSVPSDARNELVDDHEFRVHTPTYVMIPIGSLESDAPPTLVDVSESENSVVISCARAVTPIDLVDLIELRIAAIQDSGKAHLDDVLFEATCVGAHWETEICLTAAQISSRSLREQWSHIAPRHHSFTRSWLSTRISSPGMTVFASATHVFDDAVCRLLLELEEAAELLSVVPFSPWLNRVFGLADVEVDSLLDRTRRLAEMTIRKSHSAIGQDVVLGAICTDGRRLGP